MGIGLHISGKKVSIYCNQCKNNSYLSVEKLPIDMPVIRCKCPHCSEFMQFKNPKYVESMYDSMTIINDLSYLSKYYFKRIFVSGVEDKYPLKEGKNWIGRKSDIKINDSFVSKTHCCIECIKYENNLFYAILYDDGSFDLNGKPSTNGTFLNGYRLHPIDKIYLQHGDTLKIGQTQLNIFFEI